LRPKDSRSNLFDREVELGKVVEYVGRLGLPITLVLGFRRVGKSSLILVALRELGLSSIYIDLRKFEERQYLSYRDFVLELQREVNNLARRFPRLLDFLRNIDGVSIMGNQALFSWKSSSRVSLASLLDAVNEWAGNGIVIVLDEAQELVKARGFNVLPILAYAYDNLRNVRFIISGSKMGLLYRFLRVKDLESPLFGRAMGVVELAPSKIVRALPIGVCW
jgi:AAA+ ATPase superfamily predicted ATPase